MYPIRKITNKMYLISLFLLHSNQIKWRAMATWLESLASCFSFFSPEKKTPIISREEISTNIYTTKVSNCALIFQNQNVLITIKLSQIFLILPNSSKKPEQWHFYGSAVILFLQWKLFSPESIILQCMFLIIII